MTQNDIIDLYWRRARINIRLIALDMDGTLLGSNGGVSERNREALLAAGRAGVEVVMATGRRHCYAMKILRELDLHAESAVISSNGTVVRTIGAKLLARTRMPLDIAKRLCKQLADFRDTLVLTFDQVGADGQDTRGALTVEDFAKLEATIDRWVKVNAPFIAEVKPLERALTGEAPIQMMVCGPIARMRAAEAKLMEMPHVTAVGAASEEGAEITLHRTEYADKDLCIVDILPAACSKASALKWLAETLGIAMADVMAIGDNWNDVPMLREAGHAVLMANAPEDLHPLADELGWQVGLSNDEDGVAVAIESVLSGVRSAATEAVTMVV